VIHVIFGSIFFGVIFFFLLDVTIFIGIMNGYLKYYGVKEFFNPFFIEHQNWYIFLLCAPLLGYLVMYSPLSRFFLALYALVFVFSLFTLQGSVGKKIGELFFLQENVKIRSNYTSDRFYDVVYEGANVIYFKDRDSEMVRFIEKKDIK